MWGWRGKTRRNLTTTSHLGSGIATTLAMSAATTPTVKTASEQCSTRPEDIKRGRHCVRGHRDRSAMWGWRGKTRRNLTTTSHLGSGNATTLAMSAATTPTVKPASEQCATRPEDIKRGRHCVRGHRDRSAMWGWRGKTRRNLTTTSHLGSGIATTLAMSAATTPTVKPASEQCATRPEDIKRGRHCVRGHRDRSAMWGWRGKTRRNLTTTSHLGSGNCDHACDECRDDTDGQTCIGAVCNTAGRHKTWSALR
jgi:hypothetical protein